VLVVKDIIKFLEEKFPPHLAYDWDNVGLQIGDANCEVKSIMVELDATTPVINEAIEKGVDLIVTHHPFIFSPLKAIDLATPKGENIRNLIKNDIAIYTMHTNYDVAPGGMNDRLAKEIGLEDCEPLCEDGLGRIGFNNNEYAKDIKKYVEHVIHQFALCGANFIDGGKTHQIDKVAIIGGSGGKYIHEAKAAGADVFITGEITHHKALEAQEIGLSVIDVGHFIERRMEYDVTALIASQFSPEIKMCYSTSVKNPIEYRLRRW